MAADDESNLDDAWARRVSAGVAAGSRDALESLYAARFARLIRLVSSRTKRDDAFVIDCVHDAWLRVVEHLPAMATLEALDRWLARAAISAAIDRVRADAARARREARRGADRETNRNANRAARPPTDPDRDTELIEQMQRELASLAEPDRTVLDLRFRGGLSLEAIGVALGVGMKAAEIRLRRALARLRHRLESAGVRRDG